MAKYVIEVITGKGNYFRDGKKTLAETKVYATKLVGKKDLAYIYEYNKDGFRKSIGRVTYDAPKPGFYQSFNAGFYYTDMVRHRMYRISPKTGKALPVSKEWKYL